MKDVSSLRELPAGTVFRYHKETHDLTIIPFDTDVLTYVAERDVKVQGYGGYAWSNGDNQIAKDRETFVRLGMGTRVTDGWVVTAIAADEEHSDLVLPDGPREWDS